MRARTWTEAVLRRVEAFFVGFRFPALVLFTLTFFGALTAAALLAPKASTGLGAYAEAFRAWCIGYAPGSTEMRAGPVVATFAELALFMAVVTGLWWRPLKVQLRRRAGAFVPVAVAAVGVVALLAVGFTLIGPPEPPVQGFPAHALRTELKVPRIDLIDQTGARVTNEDLEGRVTLVTAVYASCGLACPKILGQARRAVSKLTDAERAKLLVLGITLDPERDDVERLAFMATAQKVEAPLFRLLAGEPERVNATLDAFNIARKRDPATGVIDHVNAFLLIDRQGRLAYRLGLGDEQEQWLLEALRLLLAEPAPSLARAGP